MHCGVCSCINRFGCVRCWVYGPFKSERCDNGNICDTGNNIGVILTKKYTTHVCRCCCWYLSLSRITIAIAIKITLTNKFEPVVVCVVRSRSVSALRWRSALPSFVYPLTTLTLPFQLWTFCSSTMPSSWVVSVLASTKKKRRSKI